MAKILFLVSVILLSFYLTEQAKLSQEYTIDKSDVETYTLKAGEIVDPNSAEEENLMLLRTKGVVAATKSKMLYNTRNPRYEIDNQNHKEFDARKRWPQCTTIGEVYNEGNHRLAWAYAAAGALADRMCIATNGSYNQPLSTEELISCSGIKDNDGFIGVHDVWGYFKSHGLVSGGKYNTNDGCQPFKIPPIGSMPEYLPEYLHIHTCEKRCYGNNTINYYRDHVKVRDYYQILSYRDIQKDVQTYGPVSVFIDLYDDFYFYRSGVYAITKNTKKWIRGNYGKLIGWGVEDGVDYWLVVNAWGNEWGQNGLFKIKRGTNECRIEEYVIAGVPEIK